MNKLITLLATLGLCLLSGCSVSEQQFSTMQSQLQQLQQTVNLLEKQVARNHATLATATGELAIVKSQRVVRLPTGAPLETRQRQSIEEREFYSALQQYQSGDVAGAVSALESFINRYPNATQRNQAIYYLGQAAYTQRDYSRAQQVLEPLVFQPINGQLNESAADLLSSVYKAQGNAADDKRLNAYRLTVRSAQPAMNNQPAATETPNHNGYSTTTGTEAIYQPSAPLSSEPLRPQL